MRQHKYAAGDRVVAAADLSTGGMRRGVYTIIKALPITESGCQYRVRSALDAYERVLDEARLRLASD